jgi:hypothetical protein
VRWRFENINVVGRNFPAIEFRTILEGSMGGMIFDRESASGILTRWPLFAGMWDTLELIPAGEGNILASRIQALQSLAPSDMTLVRTLTHFIVNQGIATQEAIELLDEQNRTALSLGMKHFYDTFNHLPPTFRFDRIELKREQINPDYEHLWFSFDNARFGDAQAGAFEFRISCGQVTPNMFGEYPKLEFPEGDGAKLFEKWFDESRDDFSSKLELRFALPQRMDMGVWNMISDRDRLLICAIAGQLPVMFNELAAQSFTPKRGWDDWNTLASHVLNILALNTQTR